MKESQAQQLLRLTRELHEFECDVAADALNNAHATSTSREQAVRMNLMAARQKTAALVRWATIAVAACFILAFSVRMMSSQSPSLTVVAQDKNDQGVTVQKPAAIPMSDSNIVKAVIDNKIDGQSIQAIVEAVSPTPSVHRVVALYRNESSPEARCPECWCVAQWPANWGDGRTVNELQEQELVTDSLGHSCVTDARRIVVVGLSGPADSMPKSDQQALELSLCLIGEGEAATPMCVPASLDYCMTSWSK